MNRAQYRKLVEADLTRWSQRGWIGAEGLGHIRKELEAGQGAAARQAAGRLPALLAGIGTLCLALAVAAFVAANWEAIPRPVKLAGIAVLLLGAHGFAAAMAARGRTGIADLATMFATLVFVSGLSLVGQMYHLPVDWAGGALLVAAGALAAAWICGSRASLAVGAIAAITWLAWIGDPPRPTPPQTAIALTLLALTAGHVLRLTSFAGRWLVLLQATSVYGWLLAALLEARFTLSSSDMEFAALPAFAGFGAALVAWGGVLAPRAEGLAGRAGEGARRLAGSADTYGLLLLAGMALLALMLGFFDALDRGVAAGDLLSVWPLWLTLVLAMAGLAAMLARAPGERATQTLAGAVLLMLACPLALILAPEARVVLAALVLAAMVATSAAGSLGERRGWSATGNLGIALALLFLLYVTVGSLLGQSVFFLVAGVVLVAVAVVVARRMRRGRAGTATGEPS